MIPAYSPQARGRSERRFGTWQGRWPPELRLAGIRTVEEANRFLTSVPEKNRKFSVPAAEKGHSVMPVQGQDRIFSVQQERVVAKDNTVLWGERIGRTPWRGTLAGCRVTICEHRDRRVSIVYGPQVVGRFTAQGEPRKLRKKRGRIAMEGTHGGKRGNSKDKNEFPMLPSALGNPAKSQNAHHLPTPTTAAGRVTEGENGQITC
jgi:hypothetical protein